MTLKYNYNSPIMNKYLNNRVSNYRLSRYGWHRGYSRGIGNFGLCGGVVRQQIIYSTPKQSKSAERIQNVAMICSAIGALGTSIAGIITACKAGGVQTSSNSVNDISKSVQNKVDSSGTTTDTTSYSNANDGSDIKAARDTAIANGRKCMNAISSAIQACNKSYDTENYEKLKEAKEAAESQKEENKQSIENFEAKKSDADKQIKKLEQDIKDRKKEYLGENGNGGKQKILNDAKAKMKNKQKEKERLEGEVEKLNNKIKKKENELNKCSNPEERRKIEKEISDLKGNSLFGKYEQACKDLKEATDEFKEANTKNTEAKNAYEQAQRSYAIDSTNLNKVISLADSGISELNTQNNSLDQSIYDANMKLGSIKFEDSEKNTDETMTA